MNKFFKMFGTVGLLAGMLMVGGCGGGDNNSSSSVDSKPTPVAATVAATGVATTTAAVTPATPAGVPVMTIPAGLTITSDATGGFSAAPTITISTPSNGTTSGVVPAKSGTTSYTVTDAAGSVDISFNTTGKVTLGTGVPVTIPVVKAPTTPIQVMAIKSDGSTHVYTTGVVYTPTSGTTGPGTVTIPSVSDFCWFVVSPLFTSSTGSTGGPSIIK
jgi:hypothetical protein